MKNPLAWLIPGNDHELAKTQYADRESASDRAARLDAAKATRRRDRHRNRGAARAADRGQAWEDGGRQYGGRR